MIFVAVSDCPRDVEITPISCRSGEVLTCTASSYPAATFVWRDLNNNNVIVGTGPTYTLTAGPYNLRCTATATVTCLANNPICRDNGTYHSKRFPTDADFPFSLFGNTPVDYGDTVTCDDSAEVTGYAVGEYYLSHYSPTLHPLANVAVYYARFVVRRTYCILSEADISLQKME